jgi:hypothetical protein
MCCQTLPSWSVDEYIPLGVRQGAINPEVLHEGVPSWLSQSLKEWLEGALMAQDYRTGSMTLDAERLRAIERVCRLNLDWQKDKFSARSHLQRMADREEYHDIFLWAIDYLCAKGSPYASRDELEQILKEGGSAWRVSTLGVPHLERRVPEAVSEAAEQVMTHSGEAGKLLADAWRELYGMSPDPSEAYRHAVRAIEAAAHESVIPDDPKATLGTMIKAMKDKPEKWVVTTEGTHPVETIIDMMETVWTGHTDRHGEKGGVKDLVDGAADLAVQLAVALVGLFVGGAVQRSA